MNLANAWQISVRSMLDSDALCTKFQLPGRKQLALATFQTEKRVQFSLNNLSRHD